jgi:protein-tyrosine phosphatase
MARSPLHRTVRITARTIGGFVAFLIVGNLIILSLHGVAHAEVDIQPVDGMEGINNARRVDDKLLAGSHPSRTGYQNLAAAGVKLVIDLRAEHDAADDDSFIRSLGLDVVHLPIRDGQVPSEAEVAEFVARVADEPGLVFVHCGAGVGRTGSMTSAYLVTTGQASATHALKVSLAVGPPSLEQIFYIGQLGDGDRPPAPVVVASRVLDAPRRIWSSLT